VLAAEIRQLGGLLGLLGRAPGEWLEARSALSAGEEPAGDGFGTEAIEERIAARIEARRRKNWAESDRIRDELAAAGILLEDAAGGTTWRRK
jgi:cysteinyl-tRNA synthetase